ncbi:MAG: DUF2927 domain-containing protein [Rhodospirillales bacterium]|nr:DUF2927 domain-containing protein [Rhodospirillales bacterium]MBO6786942.1 DUF2927 domain-containing protein [Rhodospirillales bacterium]
MKRFLLTAAICAGLVLPVSSSADSVPPISDLRRFAEDVVIGAAPGARLVKWRRAPAIRLETMMPGPRDAATGLAPPVPVETSNQHYTALQRHVRDLAALTSLPLRLMPRDIGTGGDIVITIVPRTLMGRLPFPGVPARQLRNLMGPSRCFFLIWPNKDWSANKAKIVINSLLDEDHITHCLLEELTQAMGLPNDSERLRPSIFNESSMLTRLSVLDRILIRSVYDPRIGTGMTLGAFREVAETIIATYASTE